MCRRRFYHCLPDFPDRTRTRGGLAACAPSQRRRLMATACAIRPSGVRVRQGFARGSRCSDRAGLFQADPCNLSCPLRVSYRAGQTMAGFCVAAAVTPRRGESGIMAGPEIEYP